MQKTLQKLNCYIFKYALDAKEAAKEKEKQRSHEVWKTESNLSDTNTAASIITLNMNRLDNPSKGRNLQIRCFLKSKIHTYTVCERYTFNSKIPTGWKQKDQKDTSGKQQP